MFLNGVHNLFHLMKITLDDGHWADLSLFFVNGCEEQSPTGCEASSLWVVSM